MASPDSSSRSSPAWSNCQLPQDGVSSPASITVRTYSTTVNGLPPTRATSSCATLSEICTPPRCCPTSSATASSASGRERQQRVQRAAQVRGELGECRLAGLVVAAGGDDQQRRGGEPGGHLLEHPPGRAVEPLHVVQVQRRAAPLLGQVHQERRHGVGELLVPVLLTEIGRLHQDREHRRERAQQRPAAPGRPAQPLHRELALGRRELLDGAQVPLDRRPQRTERHRVVGHALAVQQQVAVGGHRGGDLLDQPALADAGRPVDQCAAAVALPRLQPAAGQRHDFLAAADQLVRPSVLVGARLGAEHERHGRLGCSRSRSASRLSPLWYRSSGSLASSLAMIAANVVDSSGRTQRGSGTGAVACWRISSPASAE